MPDLFNVPIADILNDALGPLVLDCTIHQKTETTDGAGGFTYSYTDYAAKGFVDEYSDYSRLNGIPATDRKIVVLGKSTTIVPEKDDDVTIEGVRYQVIDVQRDPVEATYTLQGRKT